MERPIRLGILGATGMVGREALLHQQFLDERGEDYANLELVAADPDAAGERLGDRFMEREQALTDRYDFWEPRECPSRYEDMVLTAPDPENMAERVDTVLSAVPSGVAAEIEPSLRENGIHVFSNASEFRWAEDVPLMLPAVNPDAISMVEQQSEPGVQVNNPNCTTAGFVPVLAALEQDCGIERADVVTLQSISGKGDTVSGDEYAGQIRGNAMDDWSGVGPGWNGEERKSEIEPQKILGRCMDRDAVLQRFDRVRQGGEDDVVPITARTNRIPTQYGHLESLTVELDRDVSRDEFVSCLEGYRVPADVAALPSTPDRQILVQDGLSPRDDVFAGDGMSVVVGRVRKTGPGTFSFATLIHNLRLGAVWTARHSMELYLQEYEGFFD
jgi:aspartate-semialdehyde dehydrogenase